MQFRIKALQLISFLLIVSSLSNAYAQVKIDGVGVVIGKNIVLDSDIEKFKLELENNNERKIKISDCAMLERLMLQKLLAHHAVIDSVTVSDAQINSQVDRSVKFFSQQYNEEPEKVALRYGFNDLEDFKKELYNVEKENTLVQMEQQKITESIDVTPEEVRIYYNGLKEKGELPEFPAEIQLAQIVLDAVATKEENDRVVAKLKDIKKDIEEGSSFRLKAIIHSDDPGVQQNGGRYPVSKNANLVKEFKEMAFALDVNQVSEPFKTVYGYHIMQLHELRGETRIVSHILMTPQVSQTTLNETKKKLEDLRFDIESGKITFEEAVAKFSDDKATKNNDGLIFNPYTGESTFNLTGMDPALYGRVNNLQKGQMTDIFYDEEQGGKKMYKMILMKERTNTHKADLVGDYEKVQALALQKKKEEAITNWSKNKINDTYIKISGTYQKCTFEKNWKKETSN